MCDYWDVYCTDLKLKSFFYVAIIQLYMWMKFSQSISLMISLY